MVEEEGGRGNWLREEGKWLRRKEGEGIGWLRE